MLAIMHPICHLSTQGPVEGVKLKFLCYFVAQQIFYTKQICWLLSHTPNTDMHTFHRGIHKTFVMATDLRTRQTVLLVKVERKRVT